MKNKYMFSIQSEKLGKGGMITRDCQMIKIKILKKKDGSTVYNLESKKNKNNKINLRDK